MNIEEAIKAIDNLKHEGNLVSLYAVKEIISQIKQEKEVIPQFVAEWIELSKASGFSLRLAMEHWKMDENMEKWMAYSNNQELFARAWLFGYEVEQEKLYEVKLKANDQVLSKHYGTIGFVHSSIALSQSYIKFSKSDLEQAGFGWVFDCNGVKVVEVD